MKWRRNKSPLGGHSALPQIFPISWLSKLKKMSSTARSNSQPARPKPEIKPDSPRSSNIPVCFWPPRRSDAGSRCSFNHARPAQESNRKNQTGFVAREDELWRFQKQMSDSEESGSRWEHKNVGQFLSCDGCRSNGKSAANDICEFSEARNFGDSLSEVTKTKFRISLQKERSKSVDYRFEKPRWIAEHELVRTSNQISHEDDMIFSRRSFHEVHVDTKREQKIMEPSSAKSDGSPAKGHGRSLSLNLRKMDQRITKDSAIPEQKLVKDDQIIENFPSKYHKQGGEWPDSCRGSRDMNKRRIKIRRSPRVAVQSSPRRAIRTETCKIRAVEELKKAKKRREKQRGREFESFAVVKCSLNPQEDFRESMVEMISENGIRNPEELERLLACYLSLNSQEYHNIIVKVFRQVWFDLSHDSNLEERHYH